MGSHPRPTTEQNDRRMLGRRGSTSIATSNRREGEPGESGRVKGRGGGGEERERNENNLMRRARSCAVRVMVSFYDSGRGFTGISMR